MMPNLRHIVQGVRDRGGWDFSTREGLCAYSHAVVLALHEADGNFGHLHKSAAQNHCVDPHGRRVAVDVALYRATGAIVDFIVSAGPGSENAVAWGVGPDGEYGVADWLEPVADVTPPAEPPADDPPLGDVLRLAREIDALHALHAEVARQIGALNIQLADLTARVILSGPVPTLPEYEGRLFGFTIISRPRM